MGRESIPARIYNLSSIVIEIKELCMMKSISAITGSIRQLVSRLIFELEDPVKKHSTRKGRFDMCFCSTFDPQNNIEKVTAVLNLPT